jgi:mono/diheme cytochrome c family protein
LKQSIGFMSGISLLCIAALGVAAQSGSSTRDGVYSDAQADQGQVLYKQQCAMCHGATLQGSGQNPPLAGDAFLQNWTGQTLDDLYGKLQATMPATKPGSLKPDEVTQLIAYMLRENKFPAGKTALPDSEDQLQTIHIETPLNSGQQ